MEENQSILPEYHITLFAYMHKSIIKDFRNNRDRPTDIIVKRFIGKYSLKPRDFEGDIKAIRDLQFMISNKMKSIISTKGIYYWFHLYRRIAPKSSFGENGITLSLYRNILECAFLKYGNKRCGQEIIFSKNAASLHTSQIASGNYRKALVHFGAKEDILKAKYEGIYIGKFELSDAIEIYQLERLSFEYWHTTVCYRRLNKGGELKVNSSGYYAENDPIVDKLINIYDKREINFDDFSSSSGVLLNHRVFEAKKGVTFIPQYNTDGISCKKYPYDKLFLSKFKIKTEDEMIYNFIWIPFNFENYYIQNRFYSEQFEDTFSFKLEAFIQTIYSLIQNEVLFCMSEERPVGFELLKRAYRRFNSVENLAEKLFEIANIDKLPSLSEYTITKEEIISVLNSLSYNSQYANTISLNTLGPRCLIFPSVGGGINVDYAAIAFIIRSIMHFLKPIKEEKGQQFENLVIDRLKSAGLEMWVYQKKLIGNDDTSKEIDASFLINDILFVAELKANIQPITYLEGSKQILEHRKMKLLAGINDADDKAKWLETHITGRNFEIPSQIKYIVPIMISPFKEYIWTADEQFWLDENTPRICTISECCGLSKNLDYKSIITKPYMKRISK